MRDWNESCLTMRGFRSVVWLWLSVTLMVTLHVPVLLCDGNVAEIVTRASSKSNVEPPEQITAESDSTLTSEDFRDATPSSVVEDENTKIARDLFSAASVMLNSTSSNRQLAWETMQRSADLGNIDAKVRIAFARLTGVYFEQVGWKVVKASKCVK